MTLVIAPLDTRACNQKASYLFDKFGMTVQDIFRFAIDMWSFLEDYNSYIEQLDIVANLLVNSGKFQHLTYGDFMELSYRTMDLIHEFRDVLLAPIQHVESRLGNCTTQMSIHGWLPDAIVLNVRH